MKIKLFNCRHLASANNTFEFAFHLLEQALLYGRQRWQCRRRKLFKSDYPVNKQIHRFPVCLIFRRNNVALKPKNTNTLYNFVYCNSFAGRGLTFGTDRYLAAMAKNV